MSPERAEGGPPAGPAPRILPLGTDDVLVECAALADVLALQASFAADAPPWLLELVPAARTLRLRLARNAPGHRMLARLAADRLAAAGGPGGDRDDRGAAVPEPAVIPVRYDGADLADVAAITGLAEAEVIARHLAAEYTVAFTGFAPGFGYLVGGDPRLAVPRLAEPRTRVPAGAVGLAGEFTGVYPRASPGGWRLIGTALEPVWDATREPPALLVPGRRVRFVEGRERVVAGGADAAPAREGGADTTFAGARDGEAARAGEAVAASAEAAQSDVAHAGAAEPAEPVPTPAIEVVTPGVQLLVEDLGRPGRAALGVTRSGAADRGALREANRLVGNAPGAPALEAAGVGVRLRALAEVVVAVTGAEGVVAIGGVRAEQPAPRGRAFVLLPGEELVLGDPTRGLRSVIAVRGGLDVPPVLGSAATDTLAALGPAPLHAGDRLEVRPARRGTIGAPGPLPRPPAPDETTLLDVILGPRDDWFDADSLARFAETDWVVSARSDRVGARLDGPALRRTPERDGVELSSEALVRGALQVPPDGRPILFGADHPVTGGYPVIAVVASWDLDRAAQLAPGARVRFRPRARPDARSDSQPTAAPAAGQEARRLAD